MGVLFSQHRMGHQHMVPCDPQDTPSEGLVPRGQQCPPWGSPALQARLWEDDCVAADSTEPSCWSRTRNHTQFPVCSCPVPSWEPRWGPPSLGPEQSQAGLGVVGGEARGQASSRRRPGDRLQASWPCPSSLGSPANPASFSPARTSVCSGNVAPSPPRQALALDSHSFGLQSSESESPRAPEL